MFAAALSVFSLSACEEGDADALDIGSVRSAVTAASIVVYTRDEANHEDNSSKPRILVTNNGTVPVSNFVYYYYFTVEDSRTPVMEVWYPYNSPNITLETLGDDNYRVKFDFHVTLQPGESLPENSGFVFGLHYEEWIGTWDTSNDHSYMSFDTLQLNDHVVVEDASGNIIWGVEPGPGRRHDGDSDRPFLKTAVAEGDDARLYIFALMDDHQCYYKSQSSTGSMSDTWPGGWTDLGAPGAAAKATLAAGLHFDIDSNPSLLVFTIGNSDGKLYYRRKNPGTSTFTSWFNPWRYSGFSLEGEVAVSNYADNSIAVVGKRSDGYLYVMHRNEWNFWDPPVKLGDMPIDQKFTVARQADGTLMVFMSKNGYLYGIQQNGATTWESSYEEISYMYIDPDADITATLDPDDYLMQVFVNADDHDVYAAKELAGGGWTPLWLIDNQIGGDGIQTGAQLRMVAATSFRTNTMYLIFARPKDPTAPFHEIGYVYKPMSGSWSATDRFVPIVPVSFIYPEYISVNNLTYNYYPSDHRLAIFNIMNYKNDLFNSDDIYIHTTYELETEPNGWTPWYGVSLDATPSY